MSAPSFREPTGTNDVLPPESGRWAALIATFADVAARSGYDLAHGPLFEDIGVFQRLGEGTDVVSKEMYDFHDKGDRHVALRPEGTASIVRAFVQHRPATPWKVWYLTPAFRYERPQAGRLRQHHQVGIEAMGVDDPDVDVEVLALGNRYLRALGSSKFLLLVNSMGTREDKARYVDALRTYLDTVKGDLSDGDRQKVADNPLRILDSKHEKTQAAMVDAPRITEHLSDESAARFERVTNGLSALGIDFAIDHKLVRGLDYYTHTLFEFQSTAIDAAQSTIIGGGRYNGLAEALGGPDTPGIGFGSGIERVLLHLDAEEAFPTPESGADAYIVDVAGGEHARDLAESLRDEGFRVERAFEGRSMKSQMKSANKSGARFAIIIGKDEVAQGVVALRDLRGDAPQMTVPRDAVAEAIRTEEDSP